MTVVWQFRFVGQTHICFYTAPVFLGCFACGPFFEATSPGRAPLDPSLLRGRAHVSCDPRGCKNTATQIFHTFLRPASAIVALWRYVMLSADFTCWLFTDPKVPPLAFMKGSFQGSAHMASSVLLLCLTFVSSATCCAVDFQSLCFCVV